MKMLYWARITLQNGVSLQICDVDQTERDKWLARMILTLVPDQTDIPHYEETGARIVRWQKEWDFKS